MMVLGMMEGPYMCMQGHHNDKYVRTCHTRMLNVHVPGGIFHEITCPTFTLSDFQEVF